MLYRKGILFVIALFLLMSVPAFAHDLPIGGSRWSFGNDTILGFIDLKLPLLSEIKVLKEGHYDLESASDEQLRQIASEVLQPYIAKKITVTVNDKIYPLRLDKLVRQGSNVFTLWLSVHNVPFSQPVNAITIAYSLLFEETNNQHINLAYGYVSNATGDALQQVFNISQPQFSTTFDSQSTVWRVSVKGVAVAPTVVQKIERLNAKAGSAGVKIPGLRQTSTGNPTAPVLNPEHGLYNRNSDLRSSASASLSIPDASSNGKENDSAPGNTATNPVWATLRQFVPLGVEHILTGYDHIAFLLAIIVIELSIREILKIITAFTIAHSITLLLAALNVVRVNSRFVESVIALSICYVALENIFRKQVSYRWLITFGFGLIHGFGFASALKDLIVGKSNLLLSVLCFNMGVEIGQLILFFTMLPVLYMLKKRMSVRIVTVSTSAVVFVTGVTWLIERVFHLKLLWF